MKPLTRSRPGIDRNPAGRLCTRCGLGGPFALNDRRPDRLSSWCVLCTREAGRQSRDKRMADPERRAAFNDQKRLARDQDPRIREMYRSAALRHTASDGQIQKT